MRLIIDIPNRIGKNIAHNSFIVVECVHLSKLKYFRRTIFGHALILNILATIITDISVISL